MLFPSKFIVWSQFVIVTLGLLLFVVEFKHYLPGTAVSLAMVQFVCFCWTGSSVFGFNLFCFCFLQQDLAWRRSVAGNVSVIVTVFVFVIAIVTVILFVFVIVLVIAKAVWTV